MNPGFRLASILLLAGVPACKQTPAESGAEDKTRTHPAPGNVAEGGVSDSSTSGKAVAPSGKTAEFLAKCAQILSAEWPAQPDPEKRRSVLAKLAAAAAGLPLEDLQALIAGSVEVGTPLMKQLLPTVAAAAWADRDAAGLLGYLEINGKKLPDADFLEEGFLSIAAKNPGLLTKWLTRNFGADNPALPPAFADAGLLALAAAAPREYLEMLQTLPGMDGSWTLSTLARVYPDQLLECIRSTKNQKLAANAAIVFTRVCAVSRPDTALALIAGMEPQDALAATSMFLSQWAAQDPKLAAGYAMQLPEAALYQLLSANSTKFDKLFQAKPELGRRIFDSVPATSGNSDTLQDIVSKVAKADPQGTVAWLGEMEPTPFTKGLLRSAAEQLFGSLPPGADPLTYLAAAGPQGRGEMIQGMAIAMGGKAAEAHDLSGMLAISEGLSEAERASFLEASLGQAGSKDPQAVIQALSSGTLAGTLGADRLPAVLAQTSQAWVSTDAEAATAWAEAQPEGPAKTAFVSGMIRGWIAEDPDSASKWLSAAPPGAARNAGLIQLADALEPTDPAKAAQWRGMVTR